MHNQHKQYVILTIVLLACGASVFFGVRSILHSNDEVTTFSVGDWEGITLPRYYGPTVYPTPQRSMATVTLPMTSTSSRSLFHHSVAPSYRAAVATTQQVHTSNATYRVHQTSDQVTRYVGAGNSTSGSASFATTNVQQSTTSASFSMPTLAVTTLSVRAHTLANNNINITAANNTLTTSSILADAETPASPRMLGLRRAKPGDPGYDGEWRNESGEDTDWWYYDDWAGDWIAAQKGDLRPKGDGNFYRYEGNGKWTLVNDQGDPVGTPIGDIPWLMLLIALIAYSTCRVVKKKENR